MEDNRMITVNHRTWEFFLFEYFGIIENDLQVGGKSVKKDDNKIKVRKCAYRAYLDMNRTLTYSQMNDNEKQDFVLEICNELAKMFTKNVSVKEKREEAYSLFFSSYDTPTDKMKDVLIHRESNKRKESVLYYGQAQKWINMTLKYMWMIGLLDSDAINELEVPIDNYILKAAYSEKYISSMPEYAWSQLYKEEYDSIQQQIKEKTGTLGEWECGVWIAQAALERKKDKKSKKLYAEDEE